MLGSMLKYVPCTIYTEKQILGNIKENLQVLGKSTWPLEQRFKENTVLLGKKDHFKSFIPLILFPRDWEFIFWQHK